MIEATRILIIDDEKSIRDTLKLNLKSENYSTEDALNGLDGLEKIKTYHPHLIILDLGLPDLSGLEVLRDLRTWTKIPVIVLTAYDDEATKVKLLDVGADDYLTKPFGPSELLARIRAALRRDGKMEATPIFESGELKIDLNLRQVAIAGREVKLTKTEFELLLRLVRDAGKVVPQIKLMKEIWGSQAQEETHYLRIYIKQLRKKIEKNPSEPIHILTEPGVGYRLV